MSKEKPSIEELEKLIGTPDEPDIMPDGSLRPKHYLVDYSELGILRGMALYWEEVFERDDKPTRVHILNSELGRVIQILGAKKVLQIIAEHVKKQV